jgi:FdhE protein
MPRTASRLRPDPAARLAELERQRPEWRVWLRLLAEVDRAASEREGENPLIRPDESSPDNSPGTPLLQGRSLAVDSRLLRQQVVCLAGIAAELEGGASLRQYRLSSRDTVTLIEAALRQDRATIASMAGEHGLDSGALASVIHLASLPLLRSAARALQQQLPLHWPHGYCPVCAAWPVLAERRGLDRSRRLRCGRCAGEWEVEWLTCTFCGERDHRQLGSLVLDDGELFKVETCGSCQGYLKSVATLQVIPAFELLLRDLETVELDLVALDRGYHRPEGSGFNLGIYLK